MNNMKSKWGLRSRVLFMIFLLLSVVFVIIFGSFNLLMNNYINSNVQSQLEVFTKRHEDSNANFPDLSKPPENKVGIKVQAFVIDGSYTLLHIYDEADEQAVENIVEFFREQHTSLDDITNIRIHIEDEDKDFFLSAIPNEKHDNAYLVFFVDITTISEFADTVNTILIIVVMIAAAASFAIAVLISHSISKPIRMLSDFAMKIGGGDFRTCQHNFRDKELHGLAAAMNKSVCQLENYDREQKTFFQNVSHELRSPLMTIKLNSEGIKYDLLEKNKTSDVIISEVDRLSELVEDLLYISRIDNITQHFEMHEEDICETLSLCAESQLSVADKKQIAFIYDFPEKPLVLPYNEKHMYRAVYNLISNALQYACEKIVFSCRRIDSRAVISIADDGKGISERDLPHIFDRFYKGSTGRHGIGLSIVKAVIELHGGTVRAECKDMTYFIVELPMK